jgi:hypothetical protein
MKTVKFHNALILSKRFLISVVAVVTITLPTLSILNSARVLAASSPWSPLLASVASDGSSIGNNGSGSAMVSPDGRYVYFESYATNLVAGQSTTSSPVLNLFVRDRELGITKMLDVSSTGAQATNGVAGDFDLSDDGRYLVFTSNSANLVSTPIYNGAPSVFLLDLQTGTISDVFTNSINGTGVLGNVAISGDGNWIAFSTYQPLSPYNDTGNNVYLINRTTLALTRISNSENGSPANGGSQDPDINYDGSEVVFNSGASNLVPGDTNSQPDIFLWSRNTNTISRISVSSTGAQINAYAQWPKISDDGSKIVYESYATNLTSNGTLNNVMKSFLYQVNTGTTTLLDVSPTGQEGNANSQDPFISGDGNSVVFASLASNLVPDETGSQIEVYVRNLLTNTTTFASPGFSTYGAGGDPTISSNGRYITFEANPNTGGNGQVWIATMISPPAAPTSLVLTTPSPTNQNPILSWATSSGATSYNVYRNSGNTPIATNVTGTTYTDTSAPQGTDTYYVTAVNAAGESPASSSVSDLYDTVIPSITYNLSPTPNNNGWNNTATTVTFTCSDPTTGVIITSCTPPTAISTNGTNQQVVGTAVDSAGNTASVTATVNIDTAGPSITTAMSPAPNIAGWNNTPVTITYTCNDTSSGIASCPPPQTESTDGTYTLTGTAVNNAGNSSSVNTTVNIDQTPPILSSPGWSPNPIVPGGSTTVTVPVSDNLSGVSGGEYYIGDTDPGQGNGTAMTYNQLAGTLTATLGSNLAPGTYTVSFRALDVAGNWSNVTTSKLTVKVPVPSIPTNLTLTTPNPTNQAPGLSWTASSGATSYNVYRNGNSTPIATNVTGTTYMDTTAPQGTDTYSVTAVNAGGESPASNTVSDLYDTVAPTITYSTSPAANGAGWNNSAVTVTFSCADPTAGITITFCSSPVTVATDGANQQVTGTATDSAGNTASVTATVNVDATAPVITPTVAQTNGLPINTAGWYNSPVTVNYTCSDATSGVTTCSSPQTESTDGQYTLSGYATDNAGNNSSVNTTINLDQTPPAVNSIAFGSSTNTTTSLAMDASSSIFANVTDNLSGVNKVEYFVGTDPGQGNGTAMAYDNTSGDYTASFGPFSAPGTYTVYVRSEDNADNWSSPQAHTFTIYPAAANISIAPSSDTGAVGSTTSFTATATDTSNNPVAGITVRYSVSGSVTTSGSCVTDSNGQCTFSYTGPQLPGADLVDAYADNNTNGTQDQGEPSTNATMSWVLPTNSMTSGDVQVHGKFVASNGDKMLVVAHAKNQNGTVTGSCNIVDQTANVTYGCTDATVLVENTTTQQATIFGDITINGVATTYRIDVANNSAINQPDTFSFVTQSGYSTGGNLDSKATVTVQ